MSQKPRPKIEGDPALPPGSSLVRGSEQSSALAPEMEGLASAMKLQAEILKRLHDQQQKMGEALQDTRRSEMMIQSTAALNESFTGMRRVQEKLLDRLDEPAKSARSWWWLSLLGLLLVAASVVYFAVDFGGRIEDATVRLTKPDDAATQQLLSTMEDRIRTVESGDRTALLSDLERLRAEVRSAAEERTRLHEERKSLLSERDRALEALGAQKAENSRATAEAQGFRTRAESAEKEFVRMTERALSDQKILGELNKVVEGLRERANLGAPVVAAKSEPPATEPQSSSPKTEATPVAETNSEPPAVTKPAGGTSITAEMLAQLNLLLSTHRGSDIYTVTSAGPIEGNALRKVQLAVRGQDGSLAKVVEAEKMDVVLTSRTSLVELNFEGGHVSFQQTSARAIKSPFFSNRYQIVILGVDAKAWAGSGFSFIQAK